MAEDKDTNKDKDANVCKACGHEHKADGTCGCGCGTD